jgi:uncharacterized membrane protein YfcA
MTFALAGFLTGIIGGLFGVGGGEIFIPLLIYVFGFSQHQAQGTSLCGAPAANRAPRSSSFHAGAGISECEKFALLW